MGQPKPDSKSASTNLKAEMQKQPLQQKSLLRIEQVAERIQLGRSWIYGAVKRGEFPAPAAKLSRRCTRWDSDSVDAWINKQLNTVEK
jgi:prophage regulatory protein